MHAVIQACPWTLSRVRSSSQSHQWCVCRWSRPLIIHSLSPTAACSWYMRTNTSRRVDTYLVDRVFERARTRYVGPAIGRAALYRGVCEHGARTKSRKPRAWHALGLQWNKVSEQLPFLLTNFVAPFLMPTTKCGLWSAHFKSSSRIIELAVAEDLGPGGGEPPPMHWHPKVVLQLS